VQDAFIEHDAFQCGYCTPGQICSAVALLKDGRTHTEAEIREAMSGNLCRCGAYPNIVRAIQHVMEAAQWTASPMRARGIFQAPCRRSPSPPPSSSPAAPTSST